MSSAIETGYYCGWCSAKAGTCDCKVKQARFFLPSQEDIQLATNRIRASWPEELRNERSCLPGIAGVEVRVYQTPVLEREVVE